MWLVDIVLSNATLETLIFLAFSALDLQKDELREECTQGL